MSMQFTESQSRAAEQAVQAMLALFAGVSLFRLMFCVRAIADHKSRPADIVTLVAAASILLAIIKTIFWDFGGPIPSIAYDSCGVPKDSDDETTILELSVRLAMLSVVALVANLCIVSIFAGIWTLVADTIAMVKRRNHPAQTLPLNSNPFVALNEKTLMDSGLPPAIVQCEQTQFSWDALFDLEQWSRMYIYTGLVCGLVTLYLTFHNSFLGPEPAEHPGIIPVTLTAVPGDGTLPTTY